MEKWKKERKLGVIVLFLFFQMNFQGFFMYDLQQW